METLYKRAFRRFVKKQIRPLQLVIEDEVERIISNSEIGKSKKGDLTGFRVHKFTFKKQKFLIAYRSQGVGIIFYKVGSHENFYRDLKK